MTYLAFDLDGTIYNANLYLWKLLCPFDVADRCKKVPRLMAMVTEPSDGLRQKLGVAYKIFTTRLAEVETSSPIGLFRPGIFRVLRKALQLKKAGFIKGVIMYTNNSSRNLVRIAVEVINNVLGEPLFDDVLDRLHPLRLKDPVTGEGPALKTWLELKKLLVESKTAAPTSLDPADVMFFDDSQHADLLLRLGPYDNYVKLNEYKYVWDSNALKHIYLSALNDSGILSATVLPEFFTYAKPCSDGIIYHNIDAFLMSCCGTGLSSPQSPLTDTPEGSDKMLHYLSTIEERGHTNNRNNNSVSGGKSRKSKGRKRVSTKRNKKRKVSRNRQT
jgi:hypothetical protein